MVAASRVRVDAGRYRVLEPARVQGLVLLGLVLTIVGSGWALLGFGVDATRVRVETVWVMFDVLPCLTVQFRISNMPRPPRPPK